MTLRNARSKVASVSTVTSPSLQKSIRVPAKTATKAPCAHCGSDYIGVKAAPFRYLCKTCGAQGPEGKDYLHALELWNRRVTP
jgi:hypothetical protein